MKPFEVVAPRQLNNWKNGYLLCGGRFYNGKQMAAYFSDTMTDAMIKQKIKNCHDLEKKHGLEYAPITYKELT